MSSADMTGPRIGSVVEIDGTFYSVTRHDGQREAWVFNPNTDEDERSPKNDWFVFFGRRIVNVNTMEMTKRATGLGIRRDGSMFKGA